MRQPFVGNGLLPKHPALSLMKFSAPSLQMSLQTTRSPELMMEPVRNITPASAAACPTVGANCRGGITADAIGWLMLGPMDVGGTGEGFCANEQIQDHTKHTRITQVQGPHEEVKPLLLHVSLCIICVGMVDYKVSLAAKMNC